MLGALAGSAHVLLRADQGGFRRDMSAAERQFLHSTGRMSSEAMRAGAMIRRGLSVGAGLVGVTSAAYLLQRAFRSAWAEMLQGQRVLAQTDAVLASTGGIANVTADDVERLGETWQRIAGLDDEITQHGANVLLTFKNIRNEVGAGNDIFDQSIEQLLNMGFALQRVGAAGEGGSKSIDVLQQDAIRLGRALNDPIQGIAALRRVGVQFTQAEEEMVRKMVEHGDVIGAQKIILRELQFEFGNSARAAGETLPQALDRLRNTAADLAAEYLTALIPSLQDASEWLQGLVDDLRDNEEAQAAFRAEVEEVVGTIKDLVEGADDVADALGGWENVIKILIALKFAKLILEWTVLMRGYTTATRNAAIATGLLAVAQGSLGVGGLGKLGRLAGLGGLGRVAAGAGTALVGTTALVAAGTVTAILTTPSAGGAKEGDRRRTKAALFNGEMGEDYPYLTIVAGMVARGDASPRMVKLIKSLGEPPWSEAKLASAESQARRLVDTGSGGADRAASRAERQRRRARGAAGLPPVTELSTQTDLDLARAERSGDEAKIKRALNAADRELTRLLRQSNLSDEERLALVRQQGAVRSQLRAIEEGNAREAEAASEARKREQERLADERRREAQEARELRHETKVSALERKIDRAGESESLRDDIQSLSRLVVYYKQYRDTFKKGSEEWIRANEDVKNTQGRLASARAAQKQQREGLKLWRLERAARLAEESEGVQDDIRAWKRLRAHWQAEKREADAGSQAWRDAQDRIDELNAQIRNAKKSKTESDRGRDGMALVNAFLELQSQYGPNFFPDGSFSFPGPAQQTKGARQAVEITQNFPQAPTDYFREARYAQAAAAAVFDG